MADLLSIVIVVLLVLLAWGAGHLVGSRQSRLKSINRADSPDFRGINFLLDEQPDQAIDSFIDSVAVTPSTLDTHLAVGNLMRQRGEVERAIRVHQNLLSRSSLDHKQVWHAHLELGRDYLKAGLLDRAERLFLELVDESNGDVRRESLRYLVQIYRDEQEWEKAIRVSIQIDKKLFGRCDEVLAIERAHFCCELAEAAMAAGDSLEARRHLKMALNYNKNSARANILWGDLEMALGNIGEALWRYRRIPHQQPDLIPEILPSVSQCYDQLDDRESKLKQLKQWLSLYPSASVFQAIAETLHDQENIDEATHFLAESVQKVPSLKGLSTLLDLQLRRSRGEIHKGLLQLQNVLAQIIQSRPSHSCLQCGFKGGQLHWLCPQCKRWETIKPIRGLEGE